ncbi:hypothetical protein ABZ848_07690 [Streptomyces sp. NPDC047081]|uniref:hypothetical protein n=1 Tax=Streptomyces sp. NPDC047081 TaxID=3154706 RepID=UPI0033C6BB3B
MRDKRSVLGLLAAFAVALAALFVAGPAQAAAPAAHGKAGHVLTAPAAPKDARAMSALAVSPGISPSTSTTHVAPGATYTCNVGNFCAGVWDPTTSNWKVFFLYNCARYSLSNWNGTGFYWDNQTGNPTTYFYNQGGGVIATVTPGAGQVSYDWTPVWSIRNC